MFWCVVCWLFPCGVYATVSVSEVAWMGDATSANHEWIEIHNDGAAVDATGWELTDGMNLKIPFSDTTCVSGCAIPADSFVVLERTSDASAAGNAFLIYTGALVNTGATLVLKRADGSVVDQVSGGENWEHIGGDNTTKETAQYTSGGWVSAAATPGRGVSAQEVAAAAEPEVQSTTNTSTNVDKTTDKKKNASEPVKLTLPDVTLQLAIDSQTVGYVNQPINFSVTPSAIGDHLIDSLQYEWNFGDGYTADTKDTTHTFVYPGTYVVTIYAGFKRQEQVARHEITILPVAISLTANHTGDIQVNNDSLYEIDVSGYRVYSGATFTFPSRSIILPHQTVTIPRALVGEGVYVVVTDTAASQVAVLDTTKSVTPIVLGDVDDGVSQVSTVDEYAREFFGFVATSTAVEPSTFSVATSGVTHSLATSTSDLSAAVSNADTEDRFVYLALAGVLFLGTLGVYAGGRRSL